MAVAKTIGDYLIQKLYAHGVRHVFGVPGDYALSFFMNWNPALYRL